MNKKYIFICEFLLIFNRDNKLNFNINLYITSIKLCVIIKYSKNSSIIFKY